MVSSIWRGETPRVNPGRAGTGGKEQMQLRSQHAREDRLPRGGAKLKARSVYPKPETEAHFFSIKSTRRQNVCYSSQKQRAVCTCAAQTPPLQQDRVCSH